MAQPKSREERDRQLVDSLLKIKTDKSEVLKYFEEGANELGDHKKFLDWLLKIKTDKFEVWKYFEERANKLGDQMWSTGTWLMTLLGATLSLPLAAKFIAFPVTLFPIQVRAPFPLIVIALFGMALCLYARIALLDIREHIEGNWRRASYARTGDWEDSSWKGRKNHGWWVLVVVRAFMLVAFFALLLLALVSLLVHPTWIVSDHSGLNA